jgi:phosphate starvation-inducible protein PhoH and related proteins
MESHMPKTCKIKLEPFDENKMLTLTGECESNVRLIEKHLSVNVFIRGNEVSLQGEKQNVLIAKKVIQCMYHQAGAIKHYNKHSIYRLILDFSSFPEDSDSKVSVIELAGRKLRLHGEAQHNYVNSMLEKDITICQGPSGTGKTYLAAVMAMDALQKKNVRRIILVRPALEAGEKLGFLPGDLSDKVLPYLRPMYDALYDIAKFDQINHMIETGIIELAPLAYMRGRTLNDAFVILDEAQNTTKEQMKMFLTRIGYGSKTVINGDISQVDLPKNITSGLAHAIKVLSGIEGIAFCQFKSKDVVRHHLIQNIIEAYEANE